MAGIYDSDDTMEPIMSSEGRLPVTVQHEHHQKMADSMAVESASHDMFSGDIVTATGNTVVHTANSNEHTRSASKQVETKVEEKAATLPNDEEEKKEEDEARD